MAVRIGKATRTTPESWLQMQMKYDLWTISQKLTGPLQTLLGNGADDVHSCKVRLALLRKSRTPMEYRCSFLSVL